MELILLSNIILLLSTIIITVLPFLGNLTDKRRKGLNVLTTRGKLFAVSILFLLGFGIFKEVRVNYEDELKDRSTVEVKSKVDIINQKVSSLDSLNFRLDAVHFNTLQVIKDRERFLGEFSRMNDKLKSFNEYEKLKFYSERPELVPADVPNFTVLDSIKTQYFLNVPMKNIGNRTAIKVESNIIFFAVKNEIIYDKYEWEPVTTPETIMSPISKSNSWPTFRNAATIRKYEKIENFDEWIYLFVQIRYVDAITVYSGVSDPPIPEL